MNRWSRSLEESSPMFGVAPGLLAINPVEKCVARADRQACRTACTARAACLEGRSSPAVLLQVANSPVARKAHKPKRRDRDALFVKRIPLTSRPIVVPHTSGRRPNWEGAGGSRSSKLRPGNWHLQGSGPTWPWPCPVGHPIVSHYSRSWRRALDMTCRAWATSVLAVAS